MGFRVSLRPGSLNPEIVATQKKSPLHQQSATIIATLHHDPLAPTVGQLRPRNVPGFTCHSEK